MFVAPAGKCKELVALHASNLKFSVSGAETFLCCDAKIFVLLKSKTILTVCHNPAIRYKSSDYKINTLVNELSIIIMFK